MSNQRLRSKPNAGFHGSLRNSEIKNFYNSICSSLENLTEMEKKKTLSQLCFKNFANISRILFLKNITLGDSFHSE